MAGLIIGGWGARLKADPPMMTRRWRAIILCYFIFRITTFAGGEIDYMAVSIETAQVQRLGQRPTPAAAELGLIVAH